MSKTTETNRHHNLTCIISFSEIKSSKSWVKIPKATPATPKLASSESIYATVDHPELATGEFEAFTRTFNTNASSLDYGFDSRAPSLTFHSPLPSSILHKHSTLDSHQPKPLHQHPTGSSRPVTDRENFLYFKVTQRLKRASLHSPAHIPLVCCRSFRPNTSSRWPRLEQQGKLSENAA